MTRVLLLIPALILLSIYESKQAVSTNNIYNTNNVRTKIIIPWFAILFALVIGFNSLSILPQNVVIMINELDLFLLTIAMSAIGIETNISKIKKLGIKPLYLAIMLFCWLTLSVYMAVKFFV